MAIFMMFFLLDGNDSASAASAHEREQAVGKVLEVAVELRRRLADGFAAAHGLGEDGRERKGAEDFGACVAGGLHGGLRRFGR